MSLKWIARLGSGMFLAAGLLAAAQLTVRVLDPSGRPVPGAAVELRSSDAVVASARASDEGVARLEAPPGEFSLRVSAAGFEDWEAPRLRLSADQTVEARLEISPLSTVIQVSAEAPPRIHSQQVAAEELEAEPPRDLAEMLRDAAGVGSVRRGPVNLDPVVSGLRESQLATIVDGTRTFAAGPARMDSELSHVAPLLVEDVQVVNGPYALAEGSGTLAAVLVRTRSVPYYDSWAWGGAAAAGYSFNGSDRFADGEFHAGNRRFGFLLWGGAGRANDYRAGGPAPQLWVPSRYSRYHGGGKFRAAWADVHELLLESGYDQQSDVDYPGRLLDAVFFITRSWAGAYQWKQPGGVLQLFKANLYLNKKSHRMSNDKKPTARDMPGRMPPFGLDISVPAESDTWGGAARAVFGPAPQWTARVGFDFFNVAQDAHRYISRRRDGRLLVHDRPWPDVTLRSQGLWFQAERRSEAGGLSGTFRLDFSQADARAPSDFFLEHTTGAIRRSDISPSFSLAAWRRLGSGFTLGLGFGRAVRFANAVERYSDRFPSTKFQIAAEFLGAPGAGPEVSYQGDLSLEWRAQPLALHGGLFYRRLDGYITVAPDPDLPKKLPLSPPVVYRYLTGDHAVYRGFDFGLRLQLPHRAELRVTGAKTLADDIEAHAPPIYRNEPLLGIPPLEVRSALRGRGWRDRLWGEFAMRNVWRQDRVAYSRFETPTPGFTVFSARGAFRVHGGLQLLGAVENLGNKGYYEHLNSLNPFTRQRIYERGRNVYAGLRWRW